mmetsp:Transcript_42498/g.131627  ORF Transcript_42498/g.131627 Transcript_42498/m.131627 type:complete len:458 (+) Transcript_42498:66-1439(+)
MAGTDKASLVSEFIGTFVLVMTVGCNVLSNNPNWGGVSIGCSLMVSIYALGGVSGANFNPAVSVALGLAGKMEEGWNQVAAYSVVQILAGCVASFSYSLLFQDTFNIGPTVGFDWWQAMLCELLYTFVLCFVVLNSAASKKIGGKNQFYGLAIGWVIVAGAYGPGAVSGGCFNPAVAISIDLISASMGFGWCLMYAVFEMMAAGLAVGLFMAVRPEERSSRGQAPEVYNLVSRLIAEFLGTFMLVVTVGMNVLVASKAAAFSIAASLMCMIYAIGDVSGAHFNPAVTVAIACSGRGKITQREALLYIVTQLFAGFLAAMAYEVVHSGATFPLGPGAGFDWASVAVAEVIYTNVLCTVVLCVATTAVNPAPELTGFIIGMCVTVGGLSIGRISGGSLNPAVSVGIASARKLIGGGSFLPGLYYSALEVLGGALAPCLLRLAYPDEFIATRDEKLPLHA